MSYNQITAAESIASELDPASPTGKESRDFIGTTFNSDGFIFS